LVAKKVNKKKNKTKHFPNNNLKTLEEFGNIQLNNRSKNILLPTSDPLGPPDILSMD